MTRHSPPPRPDADPQQWAAEYEAWCQEEDRDDCAEINRLLREGQDENE